MNTTPTQIADPTAPQSPQPPPAPPAPSWHIAVNGQTRGPFTHEQLSGGIATGQVGGDTLVWTVGMAQWTAARQVPSLAALFQPPPPPPPMTTPENE